MKVTGEIHDQAMALQEAVDEVSRDILYPDFFADPVDIGCFTNALSADL